MGERHREAAGGEAAGEVVYGWNAVEELLRSGARGIEKVFVARGRQDRRARQVRDLARERGVPVLERPTRVLTDLARGGVHQGVLALVAPLAFRDLDDLLESLPEEEALLVLLDGVEDPRNLGAVVRTAAAAGADAVVVPRRRSASLSGAAAKAAAGALDRIPVVRETNLAQTLEVLKERGFWCYGLDAGGEVAWDQVDWTGRVALVVGGEDKGLRPLVAERCDQRVRIPLQRGMESLNLSVAAGVALYEILRQRSGAPRQQG